MDGLPAWPALFLVRLELVKIFWFVEDKCFAVGTEGFLFPVFLGPVRVRRGAYVCVCHHLILLQAHSSFTSPRPCWPCSCFSCCSCSIANNIACDSPSSSAAAVSWARSTASLKRNCFAVVAEYCLRYSHLSLKYVWSAAHFSCAALCFPMQPSGLLRTFAVPHLHSCSHYFFLLACCNSTIAQ